MKIKETYVEVDGENLKKCIVAIGQSLIERADEISKDTKNVASVTIYANLCPGEIANFEITKNYNATFHELAGDEDETINRNIY